MAQFLQTDRVFKGFYVPHAETCHRPGTPPPQTQKLPGTSYKEPSKKWVVILKTKKIRHIRDLTHIDGNTSHQALNLTFLSRPTLHQ